MEHIKIRPGISIMTFYRNGMIRSSHFSTLLTVNRKCFFQNMQMIRIAEQTVKRIAIARLPFKTVLPIKDLFSALHVSLFESSPALPQAASIFI